MEKNRKPNYKNFAAKLKDHINSPYYMEEMDGTLRTWKDLSPVSRLAYIALDAAADGIPVDHFLDAMREGLSLESAADRERLLAQLLLHHEADLMAVGQLLPERDLADSRTNLVERVAELVESNERQMDPVENARQRAKEAHVRQSSKSSRDLSMGD